MHLTISSTLLLAASTLISSSTAQGVTSSRKRGLVFVPNPEHPSDNQIWVEGVSSLTWYYNYQVQPSPAYNNRSQSDFEFVPMLWSPSQTFLSDVTALIKGGRNISHIMAFNEPDGSTQTGGSNISPEVAATNWISQVEPLRKLGVKTGAPAVTGAPGGFVWLKSFFDSCAAQGTNCTADFIPVHWYGDFQGLASHLGQVAGTYPNTSLWITEYALNHQPLTPTQSFYNTSAEYYDRLPFVDRYSYFGSFRSGVSNVGPNAAMLNNAGQLTDIGNWYLGRAAKGVLPGGKNSAAPERRGAKWGAAFAVVPIALGALMF